MKKFVLLFVFLFLYGIVFSQSLDNYSFNLDDEIPVQPSITKGKFENGLTFYIRNNKKPENRAQLFLVVNAGSILENDDQQGLAHFCEHMAFNGTENFKKHELIDYLESIGMQFGPEINAYTSFDETVYMLNIPTDSVEIVETAFQILHDWSQNISFEPEEIDKERGVIIEEWRLGRGANARMFDKHQPILYQGSKYASRLPIGKLDILENFEHEKLVSFYKDWYRPDLMAVIAVGDFDETWIKSLIEKHFANIPPLKDEKKRELSQIPDHTETLFSIATDPEATRTIVRLYYKHELETDNTVRDYRQGLVESLYNNMLNTRLEELTQQAEPPFLYGFSSEGEMVRTKGVYFMGALVSEDGIEKGMEALLTEANRVRQFGFTDTELERSKKDILRYLEKSYLERDKTESSRYAQEYTRNFLQGEPIPGIAYEYALAQKYIDGVTLDEVNAIAEKWLTKNNRVVLVDAPEKSELSIPSEEQLSSIFEKTDSQKLEAYVDNVSDEPLVADLPEPGSIVEESRIDELGIDVFKLSNGITVYAKKTDFKNDEVQFNAYSYGGDSHSDKDNFVSASTASTVVTEGGAGKFDKITMQKMLAGKVVSVGPWIGTNAEGIAGSASPEDLETMFQLIYLHITSPRKDTTAFQAYQTKMKGYLENRSAQPEAAYQDTLQVTLANHHYRARPWTLDIMKEMDLDKSMEFYKERFADTDDFVFFFVGNLDLDQLKKLSATYLANLPAKPGTESWEDKGVTAPEGVVEKAVYKGLEPKSRVAIVFTGEFDWSKQNQFEIGALADMLRIKLREVIREDKGGTYGVRVSASTAHIPKEQYQFTISLGCDPERVDELTQAIFTQLDSVKSFGPDEKYLVKIRETDLRDLEVNLKENGYWLSNMFSYHLDQLPLTDMLKQEDRIKSLKAEDIQRAAQQYLHKDHYIKVILYPEKE